MLDSLPEEEYEAALLVIVHSGVTASWLLRRIALQLGVENPADEKLALLSQVYQRLVRIYESGKKAVLLIDEAQMLASREIMEEFRGLLNLEVPERKLISFVFFGLPEIEDNLRLDPPLAQRVALKYRLEPLNAEATEAYVRHRLKLAGAPRVPLTPGALVRLHAHTRGMSMNSMGLALRSPMNPRHTNSSAGIRQRAKRARLVQGLNRIFFIRYRPLGPLVVLAQIHAGVEARDLGIAVEHQRLLLEQFAQAALVGLAPARMIHGRIHVGIESILARVGDVPGRGRLLIGERDLHDRLDALEAVLPRHHQPDRRAILVG